MRFERLRRVPCSFVNKEPRETLTETRDDTPPDEASSRARSIVVAYAWYLGTALVSLIAVFVSMKLWRSDPRVPFTDEGDAASVLQFVQNIIDTGWFLSNDRLGAPFGQDLRAFPSGGDAINIIGLKLVSLFAGSAAATTNVYFVLGFPLTAIAALWALRQLGVSRPIAAATAVVFSILPYHFLRGEVHLFLAAYHAVPLGVVLAITTMRDPRGYLTVRDRRLWGRIALVCIVALSGVYYAVFAVMMVSFAALVALCLKRVRSAVSGIATVATIMLLTSAVNLPSILYSPLGGAPTTIAARTPAESEVYGQKIITLLLPMVEHRFAFMGALRFHYLQTSPVGASAGMSLGLLAAIGFVCLWVLLLTGIAGARWGLDRQHPLRLCAALTGFMLVVATMGGVSSLMSHYLTPQIRAWDRTTVVFAFLGLAAIALIADRCVRRARRRHVVAWGLAGAILVVGFIDQTSDALVPDYAAAAVAWRDRDAFFRNVEAALPPGSSVFQLPYVGFPEVPPRHNEGPYDGPRAVLHTRTLKFSSGAMRDTVDDWPAVVDTRPVLDQLIGVSAAGFSGLIVDRAGYPDGGAETERVAAAATRATPIVSGSGRYAFYPLSPMRKRLERLDDAARRELARDTITPGFFVPGAGVMSKETDGYRTWHWVGAPIGHLTLVNPSDRARVLTFRTSLRTVEGAGVRAVVRFDGKVVQSGPWATGQLFHVSVTRRVPARSVVPISIATGATPYAGDPRRPYFGIENTTVETPTAQTVWARARTLLAESAVPAGARR